MYRGIFMATIKQIAEITNVSRGTIDRVLNNRGGVSPETEKKVRAAMEALNYLPNKAAQNLAVRRKKLKFGFILISPNNYNPFFADVERGIRKKALELEEFGVTVDIRFTPINEINKQLELLDTPGILWPKFEDQQVGLHLAMIGSINDEILNVEELALSVIDYLTAEYPGTLEKRFGFEGVTDRVEILGEIARVRGCLKKGNELDYEKAARLLMDDFRSGKLGRITLEKPE